MKEIDWSKAPEGATHYHYDCGCSWLRDGERPAYFRNGKWVEYTNPDTGRAHINDEVYSVPRPAAAPAVPAWTGTGLPPVGTVCEVSHCGNPFNKCTIRYMGTELCVVDHDAPHRDQHYHLSSVKFRPRTPEQIAAEEREKAVDEMMAAAYDPWIAMRRFCEKLYDSGYRRQESKE